MTLDQLVELFKWMTLINIGIMILSAILIGLLKDLIFKMHGTFFGIAKEHLATIMYGYLGVYKLLIIVFNLVPYIAMKLLAN